MAERKSPVICSSSYWPNNTSLRNQISLPLTLTLRPLESIDPPITSSFSSQKLSLYRCHACKAFINMLCPITTKHEYSCSLCGCTNRLSQQINSIGNEMMNPVYTCVTSNPNHRSKDCDERVFVFAIGLGSDKNLVNYGVHVIKNWLQILKQEQTAQNLKIKHKVMLVGFDRHIHEYKLDTSCQQNPQLSKMVNTHLSTKHDDFVQDPSFFIQVPKHSHFVESILDDIMQNTTGETGSSCQGLLPALENILCQCGSSVGKIFIITGVSETVEAFTSIEQQPQQFHTNFSLNKKKCLAESLVNLLAKTQMAVSIFLSSKVFINLMPLYSVTKLTNGQLKHYLPSNSHQFYYEFQRSLCVDSFQMGTESVLKVRCSNGVKLVSIFGQYRPYGKDQIEMLTCSANKLYTFEFMIQGKIQQSHINIQFSILWTNAQGERVFKIITHSQKVTENKEKVIQSIDYANVNHAYLWAILYNMDLNVRIKNLQITLQQRCRQHIKAVSKTSTPPKQTLPYILFTFYLMRHFILNTKYERNVNYDKSIEIRSRIINGDLSDIHAIWPLVYKIGKDTVDVVEMRYQEVKKSEIGVVVWQGDFAHVFISNEQIRKQVKRAKNDTKEWRSLINEKEQLEPLAAVLKQIQEESASGYLQILMLESLEGVCILDEVGPLGYQNFVHYVSS